MVSFGSGIHHPRRLYSSVRPHRGGFMPLVGPLIGAVAPYLLETLVRKITGSGRRHTTRRVHRHRTGTRTGTSLRSVHRAGSWKVTGQGRSRRVHRHRRVTSGYGVRRVGRVPTRRLAGTRTRPRRVGRPRTTYRRHHVASGMRRRVVHRRVTHRTRRVRRMPLFI